MNKNIIIVLIALLIIGGVLYFITYEDREEIETEENEEAVEEDDEEALPEEEDEEDVEAEVMGESETISLIDCLEEEGMTIYGSKTCPACTMLADSLGGYEAIDPIYVECTDDWDRCEENKETGFVPEIHIEDELYEGGRSPEELAEAVGCEL